MVMWLEVRGDFEGEGWCFLLLDWLVGDGWYGDSVDGLLGYWWGLLVWGIWGLLLVVVFREKV